MMRHSRIALGITIGVCGGIIGCTSAQSTTTLSAPSTQKCQAQVSTSTTSFPENGGTGSLTVSTTRDCAWSATVSANWVTVASSSGQGEATVSYSVAPNSVPQSRTASIAVGDQSVQIVEAAARCRYTLGSSSVRVGPGGGSLAVTLQTLPGCGWTASSDSGWLKVSTGTSGNSSATIGFTVAANTGGERVGQALIGGERYVVTQSGASAPGQSPPPVPAPSPPSPTPTPSPPPSSPPPAASDPGQGSGDSGGNNGGGEDGDNDNGKGKGKDDGDGKGKGKK